MNKVKLGDTKIEIIDGDRGKNYPSKFDFLNNGFCVFLDASNVTKSGFNLESPLYISKEKSDLMRNGKLEKDDIVITTRGTVGNLAYYDEGINLNYKNIRINSGMLIIRNSKDFNTKYLYYLLKSDIVAEQIRQKTTGSSQPQITVGILNELILLIPPLSTQTNIVRILSLLDEKIELNNKINKELEAMAKEIYNYWFVQNADKGWEKKKIVELIINQKNGDWGKETKQGNYTEKVICIRGTDINSLTGNNELKAPERYILEKNNDKFLADGDFIIEISGGSPTQSTGRIAYILDEMLKGFENPLICSNFCKAITLENKNLFYYFIFTWKQLYDNGLFFGYEGKTSGIKNFLFDNFVSFYKIAVPTIPILQKFNKTVSPIFSNIIKNRQENAYLAQLRDFLLPLLMNGQITIKDNESNADKILPFNNQEKNDQKFDLWIKNQRLAARGETDLQTLREIFNNMDDDDK